jgi:hypothetical protein|tara:strand:- start:7336 stop:7626 length:291 start_codon:yes stop_codon:yes gene_type:complete
MNFKDIKFDKLDDFPYGINAMLSFGDYDVSVIQNPMSYGNKQGLYEIGVFKGEDMVELPGITNENDTIAGFLTQDAVMVLLKKMYTITGVLPNEFN